MGFFYEESEQVENGKTYAVLKSKHRASRIFLVFPFSALIFFVLIYSGFNVLENIYLKLAFFLFIGIFTLLIILQTYEVRKTWFIRFRGKEVKVKKGLTISSSKPTEIWIEK